MQLLSSECGLMTTGIPITIGDEHHMIWARLRLLISDGDGLRMALDWNGASSMKPCFRHWNVLSRDDKTDRLRHATCDYVDITEHDPSKFKVWPKADFEEMADLLAEASSQWLAGAIPKARLKEMRQSLGFKPSRHSLLVCPQLRPHIDWQSVVRYDWVHTFCSGGVLSIAMWHLVKAAESMKVATQNDISNFLKEPWVTPFHRRAHGRKLWVIFGEHWAQSNDDSETIKCTCIELMELYGLMRYWALVRLPRLEELELPLQQYLKASACVDIITKAKRRQMPMKIASVALRQGLQEWLASHKEAFGTGGVKPKAHWAFDIADQLALDPAVIDSFVVERLHLRVRAASEHIRFLEGYEQSVLSRVLNEQARVLKCQTTKGLVGRTAPFPGLPSATVSDNLEVLGFHAHVGDFVKRGEDVAKVLACAEEGHELFLVVELHFVVCSCSARSSTWRSQALRSVWPAIEVAEVVAWKDLGEGKTLLIVE